MEAARELRRAFLPLEIYPVSAGVKGGLAGSVAMAFTAMLYGLVSGNGIWYPVNLLAAGFLAVGLRRAGERLALLRVELEAVVLPSSTVAFPVALTMTGRGRGREES
jgi:hypothetical protein